MIPARTIATIATILAALAKLFPALMDEINKAAARADANRAVATQARADENAGLITQAIANAQARIGLAPLGRSDAPAAPSGPAQP